MVDFKKLSKDTREIALEIREEGFTGRCGILRMKIADDLLRASTHAQYIHEQEARESEVLREREEKAP